MADDKETTEVMRKGRELKQFVNSDVWKQIKQKLQDRMYQYRDVTTIGETDPERIMMDISARQRVVKTIEEWLFDVENDAEKYDTNKQVAIKHKKGYIVNRE